MSNLSRQECDLFAHACCRVTYGWEEAYPRTLSPLVTLGVIFTDSRAHFVPLRSCVMGQIGGNNCLALPKAHLCKTTQTGFYHSACRNLKINQKCEWGAQVLGGTAPAGLLDLVYMRCLDTGNPCAVLPRHNSLHHKHCCPKLKSAHSRKKDDASQTQTAAWGCSVCFPCSGSFD